MKIIVELLLPIIAFLVGFKIMITIMSSPAGKVLQIIRESVPIITIILILFLSTTIISSRYEARRLDTLANVEYDNIIFNRTQIDNINNQLETAVREYAEHEGEVFTDSSDISSVIVASQIYPELKSDQLYQSLMNSYKEYNSNLMLSIKKYNNLIFERRLLNDRPIIGVFIPTSNLKTIKNTEIK